VVVDSQYSRACWLSALPAQVAASAREGGFARAKLLNRKARALDAILRENIRWCTTCSRPPLLLLHVEPCQPRKLAAPCRRSCASSAAARSSRGRVCSGRLAVDSSRMASASLSWAPAFVARRYSGSSTSHVDIVARATVREGAAAAAAPQNCSIGCSKIARAALQAGRAKEKGLPAPASLRAPLALAQDCLSDVAQRQWHGAGVASPLLARLV
jgi:hypothetical protein